MARSRLGLSPDLFVTAFPFHVVFDRDMRVLQAGRVLHRLCPKLSPGTLLHQHFEINRPHIQFTFEAIREQSQSLFLLESLQDRALVLKGQMLPNDRRGVMFFLCSPWLTELASAAALDLSLDDFAVHDPVTDFLFLLQSKDSALSDLNMLAMKLQEQRAELQKAHGELEARIHEQAAVEAQLARAASHDSLTGLFNRRRFDEELDRELARTHRTGTKGALLFLDLDQFKDVNDSFGHQAGDELLVSVAVLLGDRVRETDSVARLGGDEFAVLLPNTGMGQASAVAEKILQTLCDHAFAINGHPISMTASIGMALLPKHGNTAADLLSRADMAMYQAKEDGRNRVRAFSPDGNRQGEIEARLNWRNRIHEALEKELFLLHAQPILDLSRNQVSQYELLLRMNAEGGRILLPAEFLTVAEQSGSIQAIERWVVRRAIHLIAEHRQEGWEPCLEVNLSGKAFADPELLPTIRHELSTTGVNPTNLVLEVTETSAISNITQAQEFVRSLRDLGCRFALDDFGIGASSFYLLKHLAVDYLKIDGSFIRDLPRSSVDQHLVRAMVEVARGLGIQTIAEYVGDEETVRLLREYGVDYAQGYHIGRPDPTSEVISDAAGRVGRAA